MSQIAKLPLRQVDSVQKLLMNDMARDQLAAVAAKHMSPERLMRVTANAIRTTPLLQECEPLSFLGALMQCAALGLEANTVMGHAYMIPFKNNRKGIVEVQLIIGYKGLIDLARRSGHITSISANIHYDDDDLWEYEEGTEAKLRHIPGPQEGNPLHAYAIAKFKEGGHAYVVLPWAQVMKIRDGSQGYKTAVKYGKKDSPWIAHEGAMAKKTAIRALAKYLPLSVEFRDAVAIDNDAGTKVDYAKFALNPNDGATIEGDFVETEAEDAKETDHDPETGEVKEPETNNADKKPSEAKPEQKAEDKKPAPKETEAKKEDEKPDPDRFAPVMSALKGDLLDAGPANVDDVLDFYKEQIAEIEKSAPDLHKELVEYIEELRNAPADDSEG